MTLDSEQYEWLVSPQGQECLHFAMNAPDHWGRLRQKLTAPQRLVVEQQVELRKRAANKFKNSDELVYTAKGLQQSTDSLIAHYKSGRFANHDSVADYCCGIGGDLIELGAVSRTEGYDLDPVHVTLANANCLAASSNAQATLADVTQLDPGRVAAWHIDPDRRATGRRTTHLENSQPSSESLQAMLRRNENGAIKMAPATSLEIDWLHDAELEWIGHSRSCQQLIAWCGGLSQRPGTRVATVLRPREDPHSFCGKEEHPDLARSWGDFLYEPHSVILAAGLAGALANSLGISAIIPGGGYLTGNVLLDTPFLATFRIIEMTSFRPKKIRKRLQQLGAGIVEVKQRGVNVDPTSLQKSLRGTGERPLTVLVTRQDKSVIAFVAERIDAKG